MKNIFNPADGQRLLSVLEELYACFVYLSKLPQNSEEFIELHSKILDLMLEEEQLIDELPMSLEALDNISIFLRNSYLSGSSDYQKKYFVSLRFDSIMDSLRLQIENQQLDMLPIDDNLFKQSLVKTNLFLEFLNSISDDSVKYLAVFSSKGVSDYLLENGLSLKNLKNRSYLDIYPDERLDRAEYSEMHQSVVLENLNMKLFEILSFYHPIDFRVLEYNFNQFLFLVSVLSDLEFDYFYDSVLEDIVNDDEIKDNIIIKDIKEVLEKEKIRRKNSHQNDVFDSINISLLASLIEIESQIYDWFQDYNQSNFSITSALSKEKRVSNELMSTLDNNDRLYSLIFEDDSMYSGFDVNKILNIRERLMNLIPLFNKDLDSSYMSIQTYRSIVFNHTIDSLNAFASKYDISNDETYFNTFKNVIYCNPDVFSDLVLVNGNYGFLSRLSDETSANVLGYERYMSYYYAKNEQLFVLGKRIIKDLACLSDEDMSEDCEFRSLYLFKIIQINDIINNVSDEYVCALKDDILNIRSSTIKSLILESKGFNIKYF